MKSAKTVVVIAVNGFYEGNFLWEKSVFKH